MSVSWIFEHLLCNIWYIELFLTTEGYILRGFVHISTGEKNSCEMEEQKLTSPVPFLNNCRKCVLLIVLARHECTHKLQVQQIWGIVCIFRCVTNQENEHSDAILLLRYLYYIFKLDFKSFLASSGCNNNLIAPLLSNKNTNIISYVGVKAMAKDAPLEIRAIKWQQFPYFWTWRMQRKCKQLPCGLETSQNSVLSLGSTHILELYGICRALASCNSALEQCKFGSVSCASLHGMQRDLKYLQHCDV